MINQRCIRGHRIEISPARRALRPTKTQKELSRGDVLVCSTGTGTLGRVAQVLFDPTCSTVDSHVTILRPAADELVEYLGCWALRSEALFESMAKGSTGQTELPRAELLQLQIGMPAYEELCVFSRRVSPLFACINQLDEETERLADLRDALLPKLMSGEIDVSQIDLTQLNGHLSDG